MLYLKTIVKSIQYPDKTCLGHLKAWMGYAPFPVMVVIQWSSYRVLRIVRTTNYPHPIVALASHVQILTMSYPIVNSLVLYYCYKASSVAFECCVGSTPFNLNPSNAEATFVRSTLTQNSWKPSKPCHVGIHWKALAEQSQMSTHLPGLRSFFRYFASVFVAD